MKAVLDFSIVGALAILLCSSPKIFSQEQPGIVWEAVTPNTLANSIVGAGWAPGAGAQVAFGSTDRWVRTRQAGDGALIYSVLQPKNGGTADETIFSTDGAYLAVHNSSVGLAFRVHRIADGVFLGTLTAAVDANGLVRFAPDSQLLSATGGDGTLSRWRFADFTVIQIVGSGYDVTTTTFNFSADGAWQSAASKGSISIRRTSDGAVVRTFSGGAAQGSTHAVFTPDSTGFAAWASNPNQTTLWRISDGTVLGQFAGAAANEGVGAIRFTPDGKRMVTTGYLPYLDSQGGWQQKGIIRFWRVADGALLHTFSDHTGIAVTSPIAWSPDATRFAYGTYEGTAVVALTPSDDTTASPKTAAIDLNSDGIADLVFQNGAGQICGWSMNGAGTPTGAMWIYSGALGDWRVAATADMDGDGIADLIFQNASGQICSWHMNGSGVPTGSAWIYSGSIADWKVVAAADFNRDGKADLLFQDTAGQVCVWYMNGATLTMSAWIHSGGLGDWRVVAAIDLNRDGNADLLFQNTAGQIAVWYFNGAGTVVAGGTYYSGNLGDWRIVKIADLNADGYSDLLFQNAAGQIAVWYLNATGGAYGGATVYGGALGDWRLVR